MDRKCKDTKLPSEPVSGQRFHGLDTTVKLMEKYRLLRECSHHTGAHGEKLCAGDTCMILKSLRCSREATADVLEEIDHALKAVQVAAKADGYEYKSEAFIRRYVNGETYEDIVEAMNCGRNSPARWCKEIMEEMAIRLFGANGIM